MPMSEDIEAAVRITEAWLQAFQGRGGPDSQTITQTFEAVVDSVRRKQAARGGVSPASAPVRPPR